MKNIKIHEVKNISQINFEVTKLKFFNTFIPASSDKNEQSIIILIQYRNKNILLMGMRLRTMNQFFYKITNCQNRYIKSRTSR